MVTADDVNSHYNPAYTYRIYDEQARTWVANWSLFDYNLAKGQIR